MMWREMSTFLLLLVSRVHSTQSMVSYSHYKATHVLPSVWIPEDTTETDSLILCGVYCSNMDRKGHDCNSFHYNSVTKQCNLANICIKEMELGGTGGVKVYVRQDTGTTVTYCTRNLGNN